MRLTAEEARALGFVGLLLVLSAVGRVVNRPKPVSLDAPGVDIAELEAASRRAMEGPKPLAPGERIDPNTAPLSELRRLPRMSAALAQRIVEDRERTGGFRTLEDLDRVQGVGPATLKAWAERVTLPSAPQSGRSGAVVAPARAEARPAGRTGGSSAEAPTGTVDLNRATASELESLPGIGPALAARIVAYRDSVGGFRSLEQLDEVKGIGPALLARLEPRVRLGK